MVFFDFCSFGLTTKGLKDFYSVPETEASFQQATRGFLGFKVPEELMAGTLNVILPYVRPVWNPLTCSGF